MRYRGSSRTSKTGRHTAGRGASSSGYSTSPTRPGTSNPSTGHPRRSVVSGWCTYCGWRWSDRGAGQDTPGAYRRGPFPTPTVGYTNRDVFSESGPGSSTRSCWSTPTSPRVRTSWWTSLPGVSVSGSRLSWRPCVWFP